jgi:hypothetical protein
MSKDKKQLSYLVGPFKKNLENIDTFALNMYYTHYYSTVVESLANIEEEQIKAREEGREPPQIEAQDAEYYEEILAALGKLKSENPDDEEIIQ